MRILVATLMIVGLSLGLTGTQAGEKKKDGKEVTLKGNITCAKCELGVEKTCMTVIVVKKDAKDKKDVTIYFDAPSDKKYHAEICAEGKKGSLTGVVTEKDGKKIVAVKTLKFE